MLSSTVPRAAARSINHLFTGPSWWSTSVHVAFNRGVYDITSSPPQNIDASRAGRRRAGKLPRAPNGLLGTVEVSVACPDLCSSGIAGTVPAEPRGHSGVGSFAFCSPIYEERRFRRHGFGDQPQLEDFTVQVPI